jgi:hypothetical protein
MIRRPPISTPRFTLFPYTTLRAAMAEAYGISGVGARSSYHGVYAEAIEARIAAPGRQQAPLPLAASG